MLGAVALGGLAPFLAHWATSYVDSSQNLILFMSWPVAMMLLLAAGEWLFRDGDRWPRFAWMGGCCCLRPRPWKRSPTSPFAMARCRMPGSRSRFYRCLRYSHGRLFPPVSGWPTKTSRFAMGVTAIVAIMACYAFTFEWGVFELAKPSIRGNGPFSRNFGVLFLENRGRESDYEFILDQLRGRRIGVCPTAFGDPRLPLRTLRTIGVQPPSRPWCGTILPGRRNTRRRLLEFGSPEQAVDRHDRGPFRRAASLRNGTDPDPLRVCRRGNLSCLFWRRSRSIYQGIGGTPRAPSCFGPARQDNFRTADAGTRRGKKELHR